MKTHLTRRAFLRTATTAAAGLALAPSLGRAAGTAGRPGRFSFVLLGDLHYDKMEHHDLAWLDRTHPNDLSQIRNYTRITHEVMPALFATVRDTVAELNKSPDTRVAFVLQAGDIVEGLCGSEALSVRQNQEALAFVRDARLGAPFLFTKGNHDVTGDGAVAAFKSVFSPFLTEQARAIAPGSDEVKAARYTVECGNCQFAFFDAYEAAPSLEWFEAVAARRTAEHFFTVVHPPVVPYGARATWHIFSAEKDRAKREKFLQLLGDQHSLVLGGHIHRYNTLARNAGRGRFAQLALSSVINAPGDAKAKMPLEGLKDYNGDQIRVEPNFSPANEAERRAVYDAERPFVTAFEYADLPGYAVVTVDGARVTAKMYAGTTRNVWRTVDLTGLLAAKV
ncbi:MAG TPA: metallophosphoesterase [Opitutaceae bacterium]|nr:metallophosphoesterase [Opitutaceae bacterium]